ncbi:MAG: leucyl aminopeptidase family protein [Pseudoalteromonas spongiae]
MTQALVNKSEGIPLSIKSSAEFDAWQEKQSDVTKNWLKSLSFEGRGVLLVPNFESGTLSEAVFFCNDTNELWSCGDLASQLPAGTYLLNNDANTNKLVATSFALGAYDFTPYKESKPVSVKLAIADKALFDEVTTYVKGVSIVRDLVNMPAGDMMPQHLAEIMSDMADEFSGEFSQIVGDELLEQNYPTIHAVGRASANKPRLLDLRWGDKNAPKVTLVGKGVCFDSGGLDLKPASGMRLMKKDMGGAAHVLGLAHMIMAFNLPINLRVMIPAVENAVSDNALRPGDVIKTRKGITVEIDNTDAEGRLVLCDALAEAVTEKPDTLIDFATLTGACRIALGTELPGFFSDDKSLVEGLELAADDVQDPVWHLPLHKAYKDLLNSTVADMTNCASGPFGGAITAALYLQEFVEQDISWVHFDVMAWNIRKLPGRPVGGEAFGVRAVLKYLQNKYS